MDMMTHEELMDRITELKASEAQFCLQALLIAAHVNAGVMQRAIHLAETINWDKKQ